MRYWRYSIISSWLAPGPGFSTTRPVLENFLASLRVIVCSFRSELIHASHTHVSVCIFCGLDSNITGIAVSCNFLLNFLDQWLKVNLLCEFDGQINKFGEFLTERRGISSEAPEGHICIDDDEERIEKVCRSASLGTSERRKSLIIILPTGP